MELNLLGYAILLIIAVFLIKERKKLMFVYTTFYIFYITLVYMIYAKMWTSEDPHVSSVFNFRFGGQGMCVGFSMSNSKKSKARMRYAINSRRSIF